MNEKIKKIQGPPEIAPEPSPQITPEMVQTVLEILEKKGMIHYMAGGAYIPTESGWKLLTEIKPVREEIVAYGCEDVKAVNQEAIMITKSEDIKKDIDSTIAVKANKACKDLSEEFKNALKEAKKIEITIEAGGEVEKITAYGSPALKLTSKEEIVIRKDSLIDRRTVAILADKAAGELKQELVEKLRNRETEVNIILEILP